MFTRFNVNMRERKSTDFRVKQLNYIQRRVVPCTKFQLELQICGCLPRASSIGVINPTNRASVILEIEVSIFTAAASVGRNRSIIHDAVL